MEQQAAAPIRSVPGHAALGLIHGLPVYDLDRLHLQPRALEDFIALPEQLRLVNVASSSAFIRLDDCGGTSSGSYPGGRGEADEAGAQQQR